VELFLEALRSMVTTLGIDPSIAVVHGPTDILGMDESDYAQTLGDSDREKPARARRRRSTPVVAEDRLREDVVGRRPNSSTRNVDAVEVAT
jgi:hypothetical protein